MSETRTRTGKLVTLAAAITALSAAVATPFTSAHAQMDLRQIYLGWDFGNGFGTGVGQVPSAYNPRPTLRLAILLRPLCSGVIGIATAPRIVMAAAQGHQFYGPGAPLRRTASLKSCRTALA
jgi:hypothetical protein